MLSWMIVSAAGIAVVCWFSQLPELGSVIGLWLAALALLIKTRRALLPVLFISGLCWGVYYGHQLLDSLLPAEFEVVDLWVEGEVIGLPQTDVVRAQPSQRFILQLTAPLCLAQPPSHCTSDVSRIRLRWYEQSSVKPGQRWRLRVKAKRPNGMANPGGFDYQSWLIAQGIGAVGYVRADPQNRLLADSFWTIDRLRWDFAERIDSHTSDLANSALLKALLLGDKRGIDRQQWELFSQTGISHLVVISGLHVGLISGLCFCLCRLAVLLLCPSASAERWAACAAIAAAIGYALLAGFTLPTQRALIMITLLMILVVSQRNISPWLGLVAALWVCLLMDPLAPVSHSFWLSFAAVACLFYAALGRHSPRYRRWRWLAAQYAVFVGLLPILAIRLGQVSLLSPLVNTLLVPLFSLVIIPLNLIAGLLLWVNEGLAVWLWVLLDALLSRVWTVLHWLLEQADMAVVSVAGPSIGISLLAVLAVLVLLLPRGMPLKGLALLVLVPLFAAPAYVPPTGDVRFTVLDTGQGLSVVIQTRQHVMVYDVGPTLGDDFDVATAALVPFLYERSIDKVDVLLISHADNDHAGAWPRVPKLMDVGRLIYGEPLAPLTALDTSPCRAGDHWWWDGVHFELLWPQPEPNLEKQHSHGKDKLLESKRSSNNHSCVLKITSGQSRFLVPGDIDRSIESYLSRTIPEQLAADVLIAAHHGSNSSSSWPFIKSVSPQYVVFSSGYRNRYQHPHVSVQARYESIKAHMLSTSETGAIDFSVIDGQLQAPRLYRQQHKRYWH